MIEIREGAPARGDLYEFDPSIGTLFVELRCPKCCRFLSSKDPEDLRRVRLKVVTGGETVDRIIGYRCSRCGDVEPRFEWVEPPA